MKNDLKKPVIVERLEQIANDKTLKATNEKLNQTQRNKMKIELLDLIMENLRQNVNSEYIDMGRTKDGIVLTLDNETVGLIPIALDIKIMGLDYELDFETQEYENDKIAKEQAKAEKLKAKAEKIKRDTECRKATKTE